MEYPKIRGEKNFYNIESLQLYSSIYSIMKQKGGAGFDSSKLKYLEVKEPRSYVRHALFYNATKCEKTYSKMVIYERLEKMFSMVHDSSVKAQAIAFDRLCIIGLLFLAFSIFLVEFKTIFMLTSLMHWSLFTVCMNLL